MITAQDIDSNIFRSIDYQSESDYVAIAVFINAESRAQHAALIIRYSGVSYLVHYTSHAVEMLNSIPDGFYFQKGLNLIHSYLVPAFHAYCKQVVMHANPTYGYYYDGSLYDKDGKYFSSAGRPEIMSCVGFCISVILGFIEADEYFRFPDWAHETLEGIDWYIQYFTNKFQLLFPDQNIAELLHNVRRIRPSELITSAFLEKVPILKSQVDEIIQPVEASLINKYLSATLAQ